MDASTRLAILFRRYFDKKCTQREKDELFELLLHSEHDETLRRLIDETWAQGLPDLPDHVQDRQTAERILDHIVRSGRATDLAKGATPPSSDTRTRIAHILPGFRAAAARCRAMGVRVAAVMSGASVMRYAAALLGLVLASFLAYYFLHPSPSAIPARLVSAPPPPAGRFLNLPDGSKILLHKDARIDFDTAFAGKTREVTLHGEAYFDIRHDTRPFIVHTGSITTTVLGTAFNINAQEKNIVVTVAKGKVKVENNSGDFSILKRNEQITVDVLRHSLTKTLVDAGEAIAWKKPYLLFNDIPIGEATQELEQRFHVTIVFANPALQNCPVTASFTEGEPLEQIVKVLTKINNMEYKFDNNGEIMLTGEGCR